MVQADARFAEAVTLAVAEIERRSEAEVIVVAAPRSGAYNDIPWRVALGATFFMLALLVWLPTPFDPNWFLADCGAAAALAALAADRVPIFLRAVAGTARMSRQVKEAAEAAFTAENVHATRRRTGVLIYLSALEQQVRVLPDHGVLGHLAPSRLAALSIRASSLEAFLADLAALGEVLAEALPAEESDNPNEAPDAPRVRE